MGQKENKTGYNSPVFLSSKLGQIGNIHYLCKHIRSLFKTIEFLAFYNYNYVIIQRDCFNPFFEGGHFS